MGTRIVVFHYFAVGLGYFGLSTVLVVMFHAEGFSAADIALMVMAFTLCNKVAKIPLALWMDRMEASTSALIGCVIAAVGLVGLSFAGTLATTLLCLAFAGVGISVNGLASKQLAADASDAASSRARVFAVINVGVNVATAVAAPAALFVADRSSYDTVLFLVAGSYCVAGLLTFLSHARQRTRPVKAPPGTWRVYRGMLAKPGFPSFLLVNAFGWFLYGQLFNVLALHVSQGLREPTRLGWLYTINALLVVVAQVAVTRMVERWSGGRQTVNAIAAYATFGLSFVCAYLVPGYAGAVVFVVAFTVAEMMFYPTMDVLLLELVGTESRAIAYSIASISTAIGESLGGGVGVFGYQWLVDRGHGREFWLIAAAVAAVFALTTVRLRTTMKSPTLVEQQG